MAQQKKSKSPNNIEHTLKNKNNENKKPKTLKSSFTDDKFFKFSAAMFSELEKSIQTQEKTYLRMFKSFEKFIVSRKDEKTKISLSEFKSLVDNKQLNNVVGDQHSKYMFKV